MRRVVGSTQDGRSGRRNESGQAANTQGAPSLCLQATCPAISITRGFRCILQRSACTHAASEIGEAADHDLYLCTLFAARTMRSHYSPRLPFKLQVPSLASAPPAPPTLCTNRGDVDDVAGRCHMLRMHLQVKQTMARIKQVLTERARAEPNPRVRSLAMDKIHAN